MRHVTRLAAVLLALLMLSPALAADGADLGMSYDTIVQGKKKPALVLRPEQGIKRIVIKLEGDDGKTQTLRATKLRAGATKRLPFRLAIGTTKYTATVNVTWSDRTKSTFQSGFEATRVGPLKINISAKDVDLDERRLACTATNPVRRVALAIIGESGNVIEELEETFDPPAATGTPLTMEWPELSEQILRMDLKVTDVASFYTGMRITPFSIEIPHEEVVFDSGKAAIAPAEAMKLESTWTHVQEALAKHGTLLTLKLFIGGYTDTVGSKAANKDLSKRRARAIASWFRKRGLKIAIYYQGFGEDVPAVETADEVEEQRNRRAVYILSSHVPSGKDVPTNAWSRL